MFQNTQMNANISWGLRLQGCRGDAEYARRRAKLTLKLKFNWSQAFYFSSVMSPCEELRHLSGLSKPRTAHSLLIFQSLALLLSSANYSWAPVTTACLIWRCAAWLWCLYQHERARDWVLMERRGIMWLPASGGGTFFFLMYMFNSYFILLSGDFGACYALARVLPLSALLSQRHGC